MGKIELEHIKIIYEESVKNTQNYGMVLDNIKRRFKEKNLIMNDNSLSMYITALQSMISGSTFNRAINSKAKNYFLEQIRIDFGEQKYLRAKEAIQKHDEYMKSTQNTDKVHEKTKLNNPKKKIENMNVFVKNIILYGPPGVGKTYNHKKIVSLIENAEYSQKALFDSVVNNTPEENITETFEQVKSEGRVAFVTFHQSFSYEDFIEGFRPNEEGKIELEDGIFKVMADKARENLLASSQTQKLSFKAALNALLSEKIGNNETVKIAMKRENSFYTIYDYNDKTIFFEKQKGESAHSLSLKTLENMYNKESVDEIKGGMKSYYDGTLQALLELAKKREKSQPQELKNHYLIIDEINRGNISKIFGELITLIEEEKRDDLHVTLPYSKASFSVPSNLYIIATMNSTDKSIALIDIALRRRFTFLKMKPDSSLVKEEAKDVFESLNAFIVNKLGADFQIGHSYFMNYDDLGFVLEYKIKPLLEEYFFADPQGLDEALQIIGQN